MKQAKIGDLKNGLSRYLEYVRRGGRVRVLDRNTLIAEIVPLSREISPSETGSDSSGRLDELERRGILLRATGKLRPDFLSRKLPKASTSVVAALLAERREGR